MNSDHMGRSISAAAAGRWLAARPRAWLVLAWFLTVAPSPATAGIEVTLHNLTVSGARAAAVSGSGAAAASEPEGGALGMCVFCHAPHNLAPAAGLWSQQAAAVTYKLYQSSTLRAQLNQPTGASRMCLSCHDGTLAMGPLAARPGRARVSLGRLTGRAVLGTDLSDDHPISFVYDADLATRRRDLADPSTLPTRVRLDAQNQLQCTTCHDPHESGRRRFLVADNRGSRLCTFCHRIDGWPGSAHATSNATRKGGGRDPWPNSSYQTVADNGCANCHEQHGAKHPEWLLAQLTQSEGCLVCHDGSVAASDVSRALRSPSAHPVERTQGLHRPNEDPLFMERHVSCTDCHEPHSARASADPGSRSADRLGRISGVDASGRKIERAQWEYEVCYRCHGVRGDSEFLAGRSFALVRRDNLASIRLEFSSSNPSFHPIEARGRNDKIEGLESSYTAASLIRCTDCHNSERGRTGTRGPHGSVYEPILAAEYRIVDPSPESPQAYALCYGCHNRSVLLSDASGFPHRLHVSDQQTSCAVCHDAHGSRDSPFLMNFLVRGKTGDEIVKPAADGRIEFVLLGRGRGRCSLACHGSEHAARAYPAQTNTRPASRPFTRGSGRR